MYIEASMCSCFRNLDSRYRYGTYLRLHCKMFHMTEIFQFNYYDVMAFNMFKWITYICTREIEERKFVGISNTNTNACYTIHMRMLGFVVCARDSSFVRLKKSAVDTCYWCLCSRIENFFRSAMRLRAIEEEREQI